MHLELTSRSQFLHLVQQALSILGVEIVLIIVDILETSAAPQSMKSAPDSALRPHFTPKMITELRDNEIFVFGSNLAGWHAGGAARFAYNKFGAIWGQGEGLQGQSYAIPTMQGGVDSIAPYVDTFIAFAQAHPELHFLVTPVGCGIAGFSEQEIAPIVNVQLIVVLYSR